MRTRAVRKEEMVTRPTICSKLNFTFVPFQTSLSLSLFMDLALNLTTNCRVRVLLVPVSPIKKSTFYKYVELVKTFNMVRLGDVTPNLKKGSNGKIDNFLHNMCNPIWILNVFLKAMFSSQVFQEGQMHFQFITHWTREHAELEDFQPHRRIFGVNKNCIVNKDMEKRTLNFFLSL